MSLGGIFLVREALLRGFLVAAGLLFISIAAVLLVTHSWQVGESRLILLVPSLAGVSLVAIATIFRGHALRVALTLFLAIPAAAMFLLKVSCVVGMLSGGACV
jgi:hypothetical protein